MPNQTDKSPPLSGESSAQTFAMSVLDYCLPLIIKIPIVFTNVLIPIAVFIALFYLLRAVHLYILSVYFGYVVFFVSQAFFIFSAIKFNSRLMMRRLLRMSSDNPLFIYPHPLKRRLRRRALTPRAKPTHRVRFVYPLRRCRQSGSKNCGDVPRA